MFNSKKKKFRKKVAIGVAAGATMVTAAGGFLIVRKKEAVKAIAAKTFTTVKSLTEKLLRKKVI